MSGERTCAAFIAAEPGTGRAAFLRYTSEMNSEKNAVAIATFDMRERKLTNKTKEKRKRCMRSVRVRLVAKLAIRGKREHFPLL